MAGPSDEEFFDWFTSKPVASEDLPAFHALDQSFQLPLAALLNNVPPSAHRTDAIRMLLKAKMAAVFAFTHQSPVKEPEPLPPFWKGTDPCPRCGVQPGLRHDDCPEEPPNA